MNRLQRMLLLHNYYNQQSSISLLVDGSFDSGVTNAPANGLFMSVTNLNFSSFGTTSYFAMFDGAASLANIEYGFRVNSSGQLAIIENGLLSDGVVRNLSTGTEYDLVIALDSNLNAHYFLRSGAGTWEYLFYGLFATSASAVYADELNTGGAYTNSAERFGTGLVPSTGISYGSELVTNGDMELDTNWGDLLTPTTNERSSEQANGGTYSRKIITDGAFEGIRQATLSHAANTLYEAIVYVYGNGTDSVSIRVSIVGDNDNFHPLTPAGGGVVVPAGWQEYRWRYRAIATDAVARIDLRAAFAGSTLYFDDASVKPITLPAVPETLLDEAIA